ncbi:gfo/Idh/MocA family oxidoreductase [Candidatus Aerophobetes bacterium]|uniref:Gfo/Idh/MocA family oxidoreductase n=1 Tax=Aerophobetes bacterium TaxID=2030807 RepID=A0A497E468_UNCAE|nr:MAG: gfo/Idh/MocA family oxidoreductase [Candidatus Aerophobetes bacterium]
MPKEIRVGLVGYKFMGKAHSHAYRDVAMFFSSMKAVPVMKAICGRTEDEVAKAAKIYGWQSYETSWEKLIQRDDIDLVDISTPVNLHKDIAIAAAKAGKHILCEKPMAMNLDEAREMLEAAEKAGIKHMIGFNYRRVPAIALARKLIEEGALGRIYHFRATYLQDWIVDPNFPLVWRLRKEFAGSGALGDLGAHIIDLARFLVGEFERVTCATKTFIKERPEASYVTGLTARAGGKMGEVTVDDAAIAIAEFKNGALGSFEVTRLAPGRKNCQRIEINGSKGSIFFDLERLNELQFFSREDKDYEQGFRTILVTEESHPYLKAWWPSGHIIGWEHAMVHQIHDLLEDIAEDRMPTPNFVDGLKCQEVLEAMDRSSREGRWVRI